jgi:hypothetical protein
MRANCWENTVLPEPGMPITAMRCTGKLSSAVGWGGVVGAPA